MMGTLPDTPAWSPLRRAAPMMVVIIGALMVLCATAPWLSDGRASLLIGHGTDLIWTGAGVFVLGASGERIGGWFSLRGQGKGETPTA